PPGRRRHDADGDGRRHRLSAARGSSAAPPRPAGGRRDAADRILAGLDDGAVRDAVICDSLGGLAVNVAAC
ncbi:hypothetical protein OFN04_30160, partial [Escherichia coli]|nr:hypothetical protein [Escherichia coli]